MTVSPIGLNPIYQQVNELEAVQAALRAAAVTGATPSEALPAAQAEQIQPVRDARGLATAQITDQILAEQDLQAIQQNQQLQDAETAQAIQDAQAADDAEQVQNEQVQAQRVRDDQVQAEALPNQPADQSLDVGQQLVVSQAQRAPQEFSSPPLTPQQSLHVDEISELQEVTVNEAAVTEGTGAQVDVEI